MLIREHRYTCIEYTLNKANAPHLYFGTLNQISILVGMVKCCVGVMISESMQSIQYMASSEQSMCSSKKKKKDRSNALFYHDKCHS